MQCTKCGNRIPDGSDRCPHCGSSVRFGGNTEFFGKAVRSNLRFRDVFSGVFQKQPKGAGEKLFLAGTAQTTPSESAMLREWNKPWVFARVGIIGILLTVALYWMSVYLKTYAAFMLIGSFIGPLTFLMFYWEMNIPRNIPLYEILLMFLAGGVLSLFISMIFFWVVGASSSPLAAFCEEPGKLLALAFFLRKRDKKYIMNGILVGGAVGAGFAAMESAGYALEGLAYQGTALGSVIVRGVLSPGGHVVWAAIYGGALAWVKGKEPLQAKHFCDIRFLKYFAASVALHFAWNSAISILPLPIFGDLSYVLLTVLAWVVLFMVMNQGIRQIVTATQNASGRPAARAQSFGQTEEMTVVGICGVYAGKSIPLGRESLVFGRDPSLCHLIFPASAGGVSRKHCVLAFEQGTYYLMDYGSTYGTFFEDGQKLVAGQRYSLSPGQRFYLGGRENGFEVRV